jgi:hypothetical protein
MEGRVINNERGVILVIALMFVCVLAIAGSMAYRMTASELMIARNFDSSKEVFYSASAGLEEARAALGLPSTDPPGTSPFGNAIYDPAVSSSSTPPYPDPHWTAYILATSPWSFSDDPDYDIAVTNDTNYIPDVSQTDTSITINTVQSDTDNWLDFWVKIRHKTEYDAEQQGHTTSNPRYDDYDGDTPEVHTPTNRGRVIVYGYAHKDDLAPNDPIALTARALTPSGNTRSYRPIDIITAYGIGEKSGSTLRAEVAHYPGPPILAALYAEDNTGAVVEGDATHDAIDIDGVDHCTAGKCPFCGNVDIYDIYAYPLDADPLIDDTDYNPTDPTAIPPIAPIVPLPDNVETGYLKIDIDAGISSLKEWEESEDYTDCTDNTEYNICSSVGDLAIADADWSYGTGTLLVQGNLTLEGGTVLKTWKGLILVAGDLTLNGNNGSSDVGDPSDLSIEGIAIEGAVLVNGEVWINAGTDKTKWGPVSINYNSCLIDAALNSIPMTILSWEDLSITE